jgi:hypothetical protein
MTARLRCGVCGKQTENLPYPSRNYRGLCDECRNLDWKVKEETIEQVLEKDDKAIRRKMKELGVAVK